MSDKVPSSLLNSGYKSEEIYRYFIHTMRNFKRYIKTGAFFQYIYTYKISTC